MNMKVCARCKKRPAVIFITRMEQSQTINEGICLKCARELGIKPVDDIMEKMGITEEDIERDWARVSGVLEKATEAFLAVREREGEKLAEDMRAKVGEIAYIVDEIDRLSANDVATYRDRLAERIREALADNQITPDETRLLTECAIHADKVAVDEELVRLRTHFDAFEQILTSGEPVGRKLDFLLQEMNREVNTTGSKCNDAQIARLVVDAKCLLEKIREQIQNLE